MTIGSRAAAMLGRALAVLTVLALLALPNAASGASAHAASELAPQRAPAKGLESTRPDREFVPGEVIVRFKPRLSNMARASVLRAEGASVEEELALPGAVLVRLPAGRAATAAAAVFERRPEVLYAEPNLIHHLTAIPNDTSFGELWGLHQSSDADIDAPEAWDVTTGSSGVIVAVVDSGVASEHPDLAPNIWTNDDPAGGGDDDGNGFEDDTHGWDFIQNDNTPFDYNGHGTHVAGTIGAQGNNGQGVPGVNWDVSLMALRGADAGGNLPTTAVVNSFGYACANGAKVVNGSFTSSSMSVAIRDAVLACPGVLFVFGAGNDGVDLDGSGAANDAFPCELHRPPTNAANVLCVGATDQDDNLASFSNHGTQAVHLAAPGVDILSTWPAYDAVPSTPDNFETDIAGRWTPTGTWARTTEASASPAQSITDSPGGLYANNANMTITKVDPFDLSGEIGCRVDYQLRLETQIGFDILRLDSSTDGINWTQIIGWSGSTLGDFIPFSDDLSSRDGSPTVRFRYRFTSNSSVQGDGAHIDDFSIRCLDPTGEDYNTINGTSMATPHVAGVAALLLAQDGTRTASDLKTLITENVDAMASLADSAITQGRLNACRAVGGTDTECGPSPPPPPPPPPPPIDESLDQSFGTGGIVTQPIGDTGVFDIAFAVARQGDGKLVMAGNTGGGVAFGSGGSWALARFNSDGSLDSTFGDGDGIVVTDFVATAGKADEAHAVLVQPDGKIVTAGQADLGTGSTVGDFAVARYEPDGDLDPTFGGGDGMVTTNIGHDNVWGVALQGDGKIVVAGVASGDFALVRYNADGTLDTNADADPSTHFNTTGKVTTDMFGTSNPANAVALQPDGKILAAGVAGPSTDLDFGLARYNSDGSLDTTFDGDGRVTTELSSEVTFDNDRANAMVLQPDGKIVLGGASEASLPGGGVGNIFALARYNSDGSLDTGFSGDGKVTTSSISPIGNTSNLNALGLQSSGKIIAAGDAANFDPGTGFFHRDFAVARYATDGSLDPSFDGDGKRVTQVAPPGQIDIIRGVVIQPDDKIVAGGYADMGPPEFVDLDFALARYQPDGDSFAPDTTIDSGPSGTINDPTPTFSFSASESDTTFECRVDAALFTACTTPHTTSALADGPHTFEVRAIDQIGNADPTPASRGFTVDATAPTDPTPDSPSHDTGVASNDNTVDISWSGASDGTGSGVDGFSYLWDTSSTTTPDTAKDAEETATGTTSPTLTDGGSHWFHLRTRDNAGNWTGTVHLGPFVIDTDPPDTTIDSGPSGPTNDNTPEFAFSSDEGGSSFQCRVDTDPFAACTSPHTVAPALGDGAHTFEVKATDPAGNTDGSPDSQGFTVDTDPPEAPALTDTDPDSPANDNNPEVKGTAEAGSTVKLYPNASCSGTAAATGTAADFASPGLTVSVGNNTTTTFYATATDGAGNVSGCSASFIAYTEDSAAPAAPTLTDTDPDSPANDNNPEVKGSAEAGSTVKVYATSDCSGPAAATGTAATFASPGLTASVGDDTTSTFKATATDSAGNASACSTSSIAYREDSTAPTSTIQFPADGTSYTSSTYAAGCVPVNPSDICGDGADSGPFTFFVEVRIQRASDGKYWNNSSWQVGEAWLLTGSSDGITWSFDFAPEEGTYTVSSRATDSAGNVGTPFSVTFMLDDTAPEPPDLTDTDPDSPANENNPEVKGTAEAGSTVKLYANASCSGAAAATGTAAAFASPGLTVSVGNNTTTTFYATATDAAGNTSACSTDTITYTEDSAAPAAPALTDTDPDSPANDNNPEVKGSAEASSTVNVYTTSDCSGVPAATGTAAAFASPGLTVSVVDDTTTTFKATATDTAGNTSGCSAGLGYTEDSFAPVTAIESGPPNPSYFPDATFVFSSEPGATFECKLDVDPFAACTSPYTTPPLSVGPHTFEVQATDAAGNTDATPASLTWTVDDAQPDGLISKKATSGYIGNDIYNTTGEGQTITWKQVRGAKRVFYVRIQNDGAGQTEFTIRGTNSPSGATVKFFRGTSTTDISAAMRSAEGYPVTLGAGSKQLIRIEIKIKSSAAIGSNKSAKVTASWDGTPILQDLVKAVVKVVRSL